MDLYTKSDFYNRYNNGMLTIENDTVLVYEKPTGALCTVIDEGGITQLINGSTRLVNDALSKQLVAQGITGDVIIHHPILSRSVSRWLTYNLGNTQDKSWLNVIKVYTFDQKPNDKGISIIPLTPYKITVKAITSKVAELSMNNDFDGLIVGELFKEKCDRWYHILPSRFIQGIVKSYTTANNNRIKSLVCEVMYEGKPYLLKVEKAPGWFREEYYRYRHQLTGMLVTIGYTSFIPGDRLTNFTSPAIKAVESQ